MDRAERERYHSLLLQEVFLPETRLFLEISREETARFVAAFEEENPRYRTAFRNFFYPEAEQEGNWNTDQDHIQRIQYMIYMLEEPAREAMVRAVENHPEFHMRAGMPGGAAFSAGKRRRCWMDYGSLDQASRYKPPYKTFFHEFGHGLDWFAGKKEGGFWGWFPFFWRRKGSLSRRFYSTQTAEICRLEEGPGQELVIRRQEKTCRKTIHQWALLDLENALNRCAYELLTGRIQGRHAGLYREAVAAGTVSGYRLATRAIYDLFLTWNGALRLGLLRRSAVAGEKDALTGLYLDMKAEMERGLLTPGGVPALPRDLYGGLTGNQIGGGHPTDYWYRVRGIFRGRRKREISGEAFAGYFEYRVLGLLEAVPLADPRGLMPHTVRALEELYSRIIAEA